MGDEGLGSFTLVLGFSPAIFDFRLRDIRCYLSDLQ